MLGLLTHPMPDTTPATIGCLTGQPAQSTYSVLDKSHQHVADVRGMLLPTGRLPGGTAETFVAVKVRTPETVLARSRVPLGAVPVYPTADLLHRCVRAPHGSAFLPSPKGDGLQPGQSMNLSLTRVVSPESPVCPKCWPAGRVVDSQRCRRMPMDTRKYIPVPARA
jgi:hypothetical protein